MTFAANNTTTDTIKTKTNGNSELLKNVIELPARDITDPKVVRTCPDRKYLQIDENVHEWTGSGNYSEHHTERCIFCDEGNDLIQCDGYQNGILENGAKIKCCSYFHINCLLKYDQSGFNAAYLAQPHCKNKIICPLHVCVKCTKEGRIQSSYHGSLHECSRCVKAFHWDCRPIGISEIKVKMVAEEHEIDFVICPEHAEKFTKKLANIALCFICDKKEDCKLLKCKSCIRSFHESCGKEKRPSSIDSQSVDENVCHICLLGQTIIYDKPVIAQWKNSLWPAYVRDWEKFPNKLRQKSVKYGKPGYTTVEWIGYKNVFEIVSVSQCAEMTLGQFQKYGKKMSETEWKNIVNTVDEKIAPPPLKNAKRMIATSRYMNSKAKYRSKDVEQVTCKCSETEINRCSTSACENKDAGVECPKECELNGGCSNRGLSTMKVNGKIDRKPIHGKGYGIVAKEEIGQGVFIGEYAGEILDGDEASRRRSIVAKSGDIEYMPFQMYLSHGRVVDAERFGNLTRFINHSCEPNCGVQKRFVRIENRYFDERLAVVANRKIEKDEELTISYGNTYDRQACYCGTPSCTGVIGEAKQKSRSPLSSIHAPQTAKKARSTRKRRNVQNGGPKAKRAV